MTKSSSPEIIFPVIKLLGHLNQSNYCHFYPIQAALTPNSHGGSGAVILDIWWVDGISRIALEQAIIKTIQESNVPCDISIIAEESEHAFKSSTMFVQSRNTSQAQTNVKWKLRLHRFYTHKAFNVASRILSHTCNCPAVQVASGSRFDLDSAFDRVPTAYKAKALNGTIVGSEWQLTPILNVARVSSHRYYAPNIVQGGDIMKQVKVAIEQFPGESITQVLVKMIEDRNLPVNLLNEIGSGREAYSSPIHATMDASNFGITFSDNPAQRFVDALYCCGYTQVLGQPRMFVPESFPNHEIATRIVSDINAIAATGADATDPFPAYFSKEFSEWKNYPTAMLPDIDHLIDRHPDAFPTRALAYAKFEAIRHALISIQELLATAPPSPFRSPHDGDGIQYSFGRLRTFYEVDNVSVLLGACALAERSAGVLRLECLNPTLKTQLQSLFYDPAIKGIEICLADLQKTWYKFAFLIERGEIATSEGGIPLRQIGITLEEK